MTTPSVLLKRAQYGGRKGRRAARRLLTFRRATSWVIPRITSVDRERGAVRLAAEGKTLSLEDWRKRRKPSYIQGKQEDKLPEWMCGNVSVLPTKPPK